MFTLKYAGIAQPDEYLPVVDITPAGRPVTRWPDPEPLGFNDLSDAIDAAWTIAKPPVAGVRIYLTDPEQLLGEIIVDIERGELS